MQETYGCKLYKLSLNGGMTCPNRDGRIDTRGCTFCSAGGSGDFAGDAIRRRALSQTAGPGGWVPVCEQIEAAKQLIAHKYSGSDYIAYFQSYTNTYADIQYLRRLYLPVIRRPDIRILSIATRPDCLSGAVLELLAALNAMKPVWIELGLQTIHETTAVRIRRGYPLAVFDRAVQALNRIGIKPVVHMIIGLPGETREQILQTADYIAHCPVSGIKLQLLHVLKGTELDSAYTRGEFSVMTFDAYKEILGAILERLPPEMVIHRLTGDGPKNLLTAPRWSADKKKVMNGIHQYFKENRIYQGRNYQ